MVKGDLVNALFEMGYCKNQTAVVINDIFRVIGEALTRGEDVYIRGFGKFESKVRKGHLIRSARDQELKVIDDFRTVKFLPGENLKEAVRSGDPSKLSALSALSDDAQK